MPVSRNGRLARPFCFCGRPFAGEGFCGRGFSPDAFLSVRGDPTGKHRG
ncbi:hypothetical protein [Lysobacter gummosus]